ncbi:MAG: hypothetical protein R3234_00085 [Thermoanaerobaculia bacterium]|nr:hypothetical protein [Thermoanaerobaculia bacterium]
MTDSLEFRSPGFRGEVREGPWRQMVPEALPLLADPSRARETLHWGRNYLWVTEVEVPGRGVESVVVKQFRHETLRRRVDRRLRGSKAERSWRVALALEEEGLPTPDPLVWIDTDRIDGPAFYVSRYLEGLVEARSIVRALNAGTEDESFPDLDPVELLSVLADLALALHEGGFWFRDYSSGNVLLDLEKRPPDPFLVDLNRARRLPRVGLSRRLRDLCRMPLERPEHQNLLLSAYFRGEPPRRARILYRLFHRSFHGRHRWKRRIRGRLGKVRDLLVPRKAYPHLPRPPSGASRRDRAVWDPLSDQPHQHAGRLDKLLVRLGDVRIHLKALRGILGAAPGLWSAYRRLQSELHAESVVFDGLGVCVRPRPEDPESLIRALEELGIRRVLLRLHPWAEEHGAEESLARELHGRGFDLAYSLPQRRELVRDLRRWRGAVEELAERFAPYGRHFQVGQAINRSKWGIWNLEEYQRLAETASEVLRRHRGVQILGPAVIDFEPHYTAAVLNWPGSHLRFDALASLLYVDRRGAPENTQAGFDTVDKVLLAKALAISGRCAAERSWITEVNWPLWEGPHAPAGRHVAVDEETAADYLVRYYLLALGTGHVERVYWWQLVARGYGLLAPGEDGLRVRPAYRALATLARLEGATFVGPDHTPEGLYLYRFRDEGRQIFVGWSREGSGRATLPESPQRTWGRDGEELSIPEGRDVTLGPSPRYFQLP